MKDCFFGPSSAAVLPRYQGYRGRRECSEVQRGGGDKPLTLAYFGAHTPN